MVNATLETKVNFSGQTFEIVKISFYQPFNYFDKIQINRWLTFINWSLENSPDSTT